MTGGQLRPEFQLLVRCCQWNFASRGKSPRPQLPLDLDWSALIRLARRHRIQGLAWNALAPLGDQIPVTAREALSSDARSIAAANLGIAAECRSIDERFKNSNIPLLFVKGLTLAALCYRSPLLKMGWDIDLLIDPRDLAMATELLQGLGYTLRLPANRSALSSWHLIGKESVWRRADGFHVELHTRLADNRRLIPAIDVHAPRQWVEVAPSIHLPTLAGDQLLAYLAVHGASSAWFRLKWISDFAALLVDRSGEEIDRLYARSQQLGAARAFGQALLLADQLFGTFQPNPGLRRRIAEDRATRLLCRTALRIMSNGEVDPTNRPLGTLPIHWTQFLLQAGIGFKLSELRRQGSRLKMRLR